MHKSQLQQRSDSVFVLGQPGKRNRQLEKLCCQVGLVYSPNATVRLSPSDVALAMEVGEVESVRYHELIPMERRRSSLVC
jgi:hypothetical protein